MHSQNAFTHTARTRGRRCSAVRGPAVCADDFFESACARARGVVLCVYVEARVRRVLVLDSVRFLCVRACVCARVGRCCVSAD